MQLFSEGLVIGLVFAQQDELGFGFCHANIHALTRPDGRGEDAVHPEFGTQVAVHQGPDADDAAGRKYYCAAGQTQGTDGGDDDGGHAGVEDGSVGGDRIAGGAGGGGDD